MSFLVYFAVLLVAAASALFGLDPLTSPLPPEKPKAQIAQGVASAPDKLARREAERDAADNRANDSALSPVYPARPGQELDKTANKDAAANKDVRMVYPPTNEPVTSARAETSGSGKAEAENPQPQIQPQAPQQAQPQQALLTAPAQQSPHGRLQDVVRRVKELTAARNNDADVLDTPFGRRPVIVIERGRENLWR